MYCDNNGLPGWGGRIRTSAWRNQNPLPYRLATPQCRFLSHPAARGGRTIMRGVASRNRCWGDERRLRWAGNTSAASRRQTDGKYILKSPKNPSLSFSARPFCFVPKRRSPSFT